MVRKPNSNIPVHSGKLFTWFKNGGSACASDLRDNVWENQAWNDSCDVGFYVESHTTGRRMLFLHTETVKDNEGDINRWVFKSWCGKFTIDVYND